MLRIWQFVTTVIGIIFRHPVTGTTIIPIAPDGRIVLIRRRDTGQWGLPGGIIDWGEDISRSVKRELEEETGLELVKIKRLVGVYSAPDRDPRLHSICITVEAEVQGNPKVIDTLEVAEVKEFTIEQLPLGNLSHDHDRQLQDYLNGATVIA
jgi:8-oxo-dGTP diphosphatase